MSDQSLIPSFQVHINSRNNGTPVAVPSYVPPSFSKYISVVSATIPIAWYNCNGAYLLFSYSGSLQLKFIIPDGQYSIMEVCSICQYTCSNFNFFLEYSPFTGRMSVVMKSAAGLSSPLVLRDSPFARMLGFPASTTPYPTALYAYAGMITRVIHSTINTTPVQRTDQVCSTGSSIVDISGVRNLLIQSNYSILGQAMRSYICKIPVSENYGGIQQYTNTNQFRGKIFGDDVISNIRIIITDELTGLPINFNGADWSLTLQFDFLKPDPEFDIYGAPDPALQPEQTAVDTGVRPDNTLESLADFNPQDISA